MEVTPLPGQPYYYPFKTEAEYLDALRQENERRLVEIENQQLRKGEVPISYVWWKWASAGLGALLLAIFAKGCF